MRYQRYSIESELEFFTFQHKEYMVLQLCVCLFACMIRLSTAFFSFRSALVALIKSLSKYYTIPLLHRSQHLRPY